MVGNQGDEDGKWVVDTFQNSLDKFGRPKTGKKWCPSVHNLSALLTARGGLLSEFRSIYITDMLADQAILAHLPQPIHQPAACVQLCAAACVQLRAALPANPPANPPTNPPTNPPNNPPTNQKHPSNTKKTHPRPTTAF